MPKTAETSEAPGGRRVRLYPTDNYHPGVASVERLVPPDVADILLAGPHPAFTTDGTAGDGPVHEDTGDLVSLLAEIARGNPQQLPVEPGADDAN